MNLSQYYADICKFPILTAEEEKALIKNYFEGNAGQKRIAKEKLISSNLRFVFKRAKILSNGDMEQFIDLISAGNEGLVVGLEKFDPDSDMRFLTYAGWWVFQRQMKQMSEFRLVSLPTQKQQLSVKIKRIQEETGQVPPLDELKKMLPEYSEKDLKELSYTAFLTFYLDGVLEEDMPIVQGMDTLEREMLNDQLYEAIYTEYGERVGYIVCCLHGLTYDGKKLSYAQIIADNPEMTKAYLKNLREESVTKLAEYLT